VKELVIGRAADGARVDLAAERVVPRHAVEREDRERRRMRPSRRGRARERRAERAMNGPAALPLVEVAQVRSTSCNPITSASVARRTRAVRSRSRRKSVPIPFWMFQLTMRKIAT
jgi:hypothetical protein